MKVTIGCKCSDMFWAYIVSKSGKELNYEGYVPSVFSGSQGEDYIDLEIDLDTGKILNLPDNAGELLIKWIARNNRA